MSAMGPASVSSPFSTEYEELRESLRRWIAAELRPPAEEWEETTFPDAVFPRIAEHGFLGLKYPEALGGDLLHEAEFQVARHKLADIATTIHTSRCLTYGALRRFCAGEDATLPVTMAKLVTQRAAVDVADECLQIHGGAGYMREYGIERAYRDARLGRIGGGTARSCGRSSGRSLPL